MYRPSDAGQSLPRRVLTRAPGLAWAALAALPLHAVAGTPLALLTLADGPVELLRGTQRHAAAEGLSLTANDLLRTGPGTRVVRIEFADGRVLDLGPATQAMLPGAAAATAGGAPGASAVVIRGWAKLSVPAAVNAGAGAGAQLAAPSLALQSPPAGTTLLHVAHDGAVMVFAESRGAALARRPGAAGAVPEAVLREGDTWVREAGASAGERVPARSALRQVPPALADTLPRRAAGLSGRDVEPAVGEPLKPADLADWLRAEPALMAALRPRARSAPQALASSQAYGAARRPQTAPLSAPLSASKAARPSTASAALPLPAVAAIAAVAALDAPALLPTASRTAGTAGLPALAAPTPARVARSDTAVTPPDAPRRR